MGGIRRLREFFFGGEQQNIHTENSGPWGQAEADALLANRLRHRRNHVKHEACIVLWGAAILVRAVVRGLFEELVHKASICAMDLDTIETRTLNGIARPRRIQLRVLRDLALRQRAWTWWVITVFPLMWCLCWKRNIPRGDIFERRILSLELFYR
jgi:hypothetical protein